MTKYDFGYEVQPGTTTQWARDIIPSGSRVLEFGPSIGYLTKALKEKDCRIDIVEIDQNAGTSAARFAEKALIGPADGNVESLKWCTAFSEGSYDAIVFLDVLEHLHDPETVLARVVRYLKPDGKLYLSVPNIAHNSIIINLINDRWEYTELGLLDNTHVHFFAYHSLISLFEKLDLNVEFQGAIQKMVGDNEIPNDYSDVPMELAAALKARKYPDAYQFLFRLSKREAGTEAAKAPGQLQLEKLLNTGLSVEFNYRYSGEAPASACMTKRYYPGPVFRGKIQIPCEEGSRPDHLVVGFPMQCCVVSGFRAISAQADPGQLSWITNGLQAENGDVIFSDGAGQIDILVPAGTDEVELCWNIPYYDSPVIPYMHSVLDSYQGNQQVLAEKKQLESLLEEARDYGKSLVASVEAEQKKSADLETFLMESRAYAQSLVEAVRAEQQKSADLETVLIETRAYGQSAAEKAESERTRADELQGELERIHNSKWWKIFKNLLQ